MSDFIDEISEMSVFSEFRLEIYCCLDLWFLSYIIAEFADITHEIRQLLPRHSQVFHELKSMHTASTAYCQSQISSIQDHETRC